MLIGAKQHLPADILKSQVFFIVIHYLRRLTSKHRYEKYDRHLAYILTFVAGAANAGGFMAIQQYTSHMSGIVSAMADNLVLGQFAFALAGLGALLSFIAGAACSAILVNWGRRLDLHGEYALPLMLEAFLLLCFGLQGNYLQQHVWLFVPSTVVLLCFIMGLQNAIITKLSNSRIRTTHVTGLVTDMGIEVGKLLYWNIDKDHIRKPPVRADRKKLALLATLVSLFFSGGVVGALAFKKIGFHASLFLVAVILVMAITPVLDDIRFFIRRLRR